MAKPNVYDMLKSMSDAERALVLSTLKADGVKVSTSVKAEKVFVAKRVQLVDTKEGSKIPRKAGQEFMLTEGALDATLRTWIKGKDADTRLPLAKQSILAGHKESFSTFEIVGITA